MSVTAVSAAKEWLKSPYADELSPAARLVLVLFAEAVNENRVKAAGAWDVWMAQKTIAGLVGISDRQVRRILTQLAKVGVIVDTHQRVGKGVVKWELEPRVLQDQV